MTITDQTTRASDLTADTVAPLLRTELPGPVAQAIIARDEAVTSPSLTRVYPLVVQRGRGLRARGRRRQPLPRLQRRHRRRRRRPRPPGGQRGDPRPGRRRPALLLQRLLPAGLRRRVRAARRHRSPARPAGLPLQLGDRGRRGSAQVGPPPHRAPERHRLPRRVPRALARQPLADGQQVAPAGRVRRRHARHVPRPVRRPVRPRRPHGCRVHRAGAVQTADRSR